MEKSKLANKNIKVCKETKLKIPTDSNKKKIIRQSLLKMLL
ncbi:hypothetical protein [Methanobrevibacter arboriphilus]|nr:hypothetical protein [Methanobrevibacter arboriphilus]